MNWPETDWYLWSEEKATSDLRLKFCARWGVSGRQQGLAEVDAPRADP